ncbi:MAG: universal stress protein [Verrucomicrobia bacterium]|nr:universal stress protein [Verrucomicrobiota bacterium]
MVWIDIVAKPFWQDNLPMATNPDTTPAELVSASAEADSAKPQLLLVATTFMDFSPTLQQALQLAKLTRSRLVLLHVVEIARSELNPAIFASLEQIHARLDAYQERARHRLNSLCEEFRDADVECTASVRVGVPHEEILEEAQTIQPDMIVIGTKTTSALARFRLGSTAERVIRHAPCPVLVVRERPE